jgi:hypothetical protein
LALPGFLEPGGLPLARHSHPGRASKGFLTLFIPASRLDLVFPHQICSVPAHMQKVKKYQKNRGEFTFHFKN